MSSTTAAPTRAESGTEPGTEPEAGAEAAARAETGRTFAAGHLLADVLTEVSPGMPTSRSGRGESETGEPGPAHLGAVELGKWGFHETFSFSTGNA